MRAGKVEMFRGAFSQAVVDLAAIDFGNVSYFIHYGDHNRAVELLMTRRSQQADALELAPDGRAFFAVLGR